MGAELEGPVLQGAGQAWSWPGAQPGWPHLRLPRGEFQGCCSHTQHQAPCSTPSVPVGQPATASARQHSSTAPFSGRAGTCLVPTGNPHGSCSSRGILCWCWHSSFPELLLACHRACHMDVRAALPLGLCPCQQHPQQHPCPGAASPGSIQTHKYPPPGDTGPLCSRWLRSPLLLSGTGPLCP